MPDIPKEPIAQQLDIIAEMKTDILYQYREEKNQLGKSGSEPQVKTAVRATLAQLATAYFQAVQTEVTLVSSLFDSSVSGSERANGGDLGRQRNDPGNAERRTQKLNRVLLDSFNH